MRNYYFCHSTCVIILQSICFLPSARSFGQAVSEKKIFRNRPIRKKNCLWRPCLLRNRDEMSNLYRGPYIDASYQVLLHLAKQFQRRRFFFFNLPFRNKNCLWWPRLLMVRTICAILIEDIP